MKTRLTKSFQFSAMHTLPGLEETHGHDYKLEITLKGEPDPLAGWIMSRDEFERIVNENLIQPLHGSNLNLYFPKTSGEYLAYAIFQKLKNTRLASRLVQVALQETRKNRFIYSEPTL